MAYAPSAYWRVLCRDLEALEADLERTARRGGRFPWVERLRERVRAVRERLQREQRQVGPWSDPSRCGVETGPRTAPTRVPTRGRCAPG
jgi:hypothetical protein